MVEAAWRPREPNGIGAPSGRMRSTSISRCRSMTPARTSRSRRYAAPSADRSVEKAREELLKNGSAAAPLPISGPLDPLVVPQKQQ